MKKKKKNHMKITKFAIYVKKNFVLIEIYKIDPAYFLSAPGLAWQACLKKTGVELDLLTDIDMLLICLKKEYGEGCVKQHIDMLKQTINI